MDADNGDAVGLDQATNVWIDHLDLSGDLSAGKDDLDGLLDITHAADYVTVSNTYFHDHVSFCLSLFPSLRLLASRALVL